MTVEIRRRCPPHPREFAMRREWFVLLLAMLIFAAATVVACGGDDDDDDDAADDDVSDDDADDDSGDDDDDDDDDTDDDDTDDDDDDDDDDDMDDDSDDDSDDDDDDDLTVADIRQGAVSEGETVTLTDVVVTTPQASQGDFFVQDQGGGEFSGIFIFATSKSKDLGLVPGDVVTITGTYTEYFDLSEIEASESDIDVTGSASVPSPQVIDVDGAEEKWESVLVKVEDVSVTAEADDHGEWEVDGALLIDDIFYDPDPALNTDFASITGPLYYSFDTWKIEPRDAADLVEAD
jgi:hypothetical protein